MRGGLGGQRIVGRDGRGFWGKGIVGRDGGRGGKSAQGGPGLPRQ